MPLDPRRRPRTPRLLRTLRTTQARPRSAGVTAAAASTFEHAPVAMALLDPDGVVLRANPALLDLLQRSQDDLVGGRLFPHTHPDDLPRAITTCQDVSAGRTDQATLQCRLLRSDGEVRTTVITSSLVRDPGGAPGHLVLHVQDITEAHQRELELRRQTLHDPLTGLPNRTLLADRLDQTIAACRRTASTFSLMFLDIDKFKQINDRYGHDTGDAVLVQVATRLGDAVRPADTVARLAGDEFVLLCPGTDAAQAEELRQRVLDRINHPVPTHHGDLTLSASAGLVLGDASSNPADLLRTADQLMYRDKTA